jgi:hypothetical protein
MSARNHPIDAVEDLWDIFECGGCGVLFFSEDRIQEHVKKNHPELIGESYFSVSFIRAIPQDEVRN